jgi:hypothetical protein
MNSSAVVAVTGRGFGCRQELLDDTRTVRASVGLRPDHRLDPPIRTAGRQRS